MRIATLLVAALLALAALTPASAASLGGLRADALGAATATTRTITAVTLDWQVAADAATLRITTGRGESFAAGDSIAVTVDAGASGTCTGSATAVQATRTVELALTDCDVPLHEATHVALVIAGGARGTVHADSVGGVAGTLSAFSGELSDLDAN